MHSRIAVLPLIGYLDQGVLWLRPGDKPPVPVRLTPALKELLSRRLPKPSECDDWWWGHR
jgi:hypothetical protein